MTEARERIALTGALTEVAQAAQLNERLRTDTIVFDWSEVERITDEAADALVRGLDLDSVADALGMATLREDLANVIAAAFDRASSGARRPRKSRRAASGAALRPQVWADSSPPSREAPPLSQRSLGPSSSAPPPRPAVLAGELPSEVELRAMLEQRMIDDLLGPAGGPQEEIADGTVRDRYLVGMLAPRRLRVAPEEVDRLEIEEATSPEEDTHEDSSLAAPTMFPSAMGLSFAVPVNAPALRVTVRWGNYRRLPSETLQTEKGNPKTVWKRRQIEEPVVLPPIADGPIEPVRVGGDPDDALAPAELRGVAHRVGHVWVVSLFLMNVQDEPEERRDEAWIFQPEIAVEAVDGSAVFCARMFDGLPSSSSLEREDERRTAMLYRNRCELAVGHGVGVHAEVSADDPSRATRVATRVVPAHEVPQQTAPTDDEEPGLRDVERDMKRLAESSTAELVASLEKLTAAYSDWITRQRARVADPKARIGAFEQDAKSALELCNSALGRMREGIVLLARDERAADAFRFANRAMWLQRVHTVYSERRRRGRDVTLDEVDLPENRCWRTFQLAFVLLNLPGVTRLDHPERTDSHALADLLWFPTGGGKTEAYLGLAAYTMGMRRLQGTIEGRSGEHGVAVLMRYTLRLLTLQQFQRAAALICACETIRREDEARWGKVPFRIGLWVGARSTPNKTEHAAEALKRTRDVKFKQASRIGGTGSPVQLKSCPWCGSAIDPGRHMRVEPFTSSTGRTLTFCGDKLGACPFSERKAPEEGLPVLVVDEEVYRRLPTLLIATVDKFAQMPWNGAVQMLFGQVDGYCARHGFTSPHLPDTDHKKRGRLPATKLSEHGPLRPPDLIIQDELHLISGPLGTLTGLYETAVDALCSWNVDRKTVRPKVIASTATIRRARDQIHALFVRGVAVFPPQGLDSGDNFFSRERSPAEAYGRRYIGICAPGRRLKAAIIRVYVAQLAAAKSLYDQYGTHADPWMTLVGYFSSLRELAGTRRLVDDDIASRLRKMDRRGLAKRFISTPDELTSRLDSTQIPELLDRLEIPFDPALERERQGARRPLDVLLATNMISVGVDVGRLGAMIVSGQPKNTAEYIQATSRVGRSHPGLVCTIYNWARPRDLSHYESFEHYHATFYNQVEALSVTPFSPRALDRGLSAVFVALVRLGSSRFNDNAAAARLERHDELVKQAMERIQRRGAHVDESKQTEGIVHALLERRLDEWLAVAEPKPGAGQLVYKGNREPTGRPLLEPAGLGPWKTFTCLGSLRDVEPSVDLILTDGGLDEEARPFGRRPE